ncbi:Alpha-amylase [Cymbomonas tetramitiformis]|uniref:Alpha-amylase n=1 Tax=Cymbomonas tetramitiformis TaxID=36881 RepID=A0AAE0FZD0_9CHLO|nr:Alpha-amylase [Cymbomonas tetramitiformis]
MTRTVENVFHRMKNMPVRRAEFFRTPLRLQGRRREQRSSHFPCLSRDLLDCLLLACLSIEQRMQERARSLRSFVALRTLPHLSTPLPRGHLACISLPAPSWPRVPSAPDGGAPQPTGTVDAESTQTRIEFENELGGRTTVIIVRTPDKNNLLMELTCALASLGVHVKSADIQSAENAEVRPAF